MKWKIVADSGSSIRYSNQITENIGFQIVPLLINIGSELFVDNDINNVPHLMTTMESTQSGSSSACPSPDTYANAFMEADNVICITLSSALSGSYNSAKLGRELVLETHPNKNIFIVDSLSAGSEMDLLIDKAIKLASDDLNFNDVVSQINSYHQHTGLIFMLESVDNLVKNGRLNRIVGSMIGLLGIRLIGERSTVGQIDVIHKSKGTKRALKTMIEELKKVGFKGGRLDISHCLNESVAKEFQNLVTEAFPDATIYLRPTSGLCSYYAQRGGLMVGYEKYHS